MPDLRRLPPNLEAEATAPQGVCLVSASERRKGKAGELEVVHLLRDYGWPDAERNSYGRSQDGRGDIGRGPEGVHFEVRRRERLDIWKSIADAERAAGEGELPVVAFRRSRSGWYACLPLDGLLGLLRGGRR
jgi:hypothetical protein